VGTILAYSGSTAAPTLPVLQAQDGSFYGTDNNGNMIRFTQYGNTYWSVPNDYPYIATADGGVIGASGITYDSQGRATGQIGNTNSAARTSTRAAVRTYGAAQAAGEDASGPGNFLSAVQSWTSDWYEIATGSVNQLLIPPILPATPPYSSFDGANQSANGTSPLCHDDRDQFTPEYVTYNSGFVPVCQEFVNSISVPNFPYSFSTMNQDDIFTYNDHPNWALLEPYMLDGIVSIVTAYGSSPAVTSAYRSPYAQSHINPAAPRDRHIHGDAVDFRTSNNPATWKTLHNITRQLYPNACIEPSALSSYNHIHIDWRPWAQCAATWRQ
jgi:hypothetical protein